MSTYLVHYNSTQPQNIVTDVTKEFIKASRKIYQLISQNSGITVPELSLKLNVSERQIKRYLKRLQDEEKITRVGGRKNGEWKIIDSEYNDFFEHI